jgi:hypothetical protein
MKKRKTGNRRIYKLVNHRLDKDGVIDQTLDPQESTVTAVAGQFGSGDGIGSPISGLLSPISYTQTGLVITFNEPFLLGMSTTDENGLPAGYVVLYDPSSPAQSSNSINLANFGISHNDNVWLLFRQSFAETDIRNQAYYNGGPMVGVTETRERGFVEFAAATSLTGTYSDANGWGVFGVIRSWTSPTNPVVEFIDIVDHFGFDMASKHKATAMSPSVTYPFTPYEVRGWPRWVKALINQFYMQHDSLWVINRNGTQNLPGVQPGTLGWYRNVPYGNLQVQHFINKVWTAEPRILWQGCIAWDAWDGSAPFIVSQMSLFNITASVSSLPWGTRHQAVITINGTHLPTGTVINAVTAVANYYKDFSIQVLPTPYQGGSDQSLVGISAIWATQPSIPVIGNGVTNLVIKVGVTANESADARWRNPIGYGSVVTIYGSYAERTSDYVFITRD